MACIRFVADPDGQIVPDVAGPLPGRGLWVKADRDSRPGALAKKLFAAPRKRR